MSSAVLDLNGSEGWTPALHQDASGRRGCADSGHYNGRPYAAVLDFRQAASIAKPALIFSHVTAGRSKGRRLSSFIGGHCPLSELARNHAALPRFALFPATAFRRGHF